MGQHKEIFRLGLLMQLYHYCDIKYIFNFGTDFKVSERTLPFLHGIVLWAENRICLRKGLCGKNETRTIFREVYE